MRIGAGLVHVTRAGVIAMLVLTLAAGTALAKGGSGGGGGHHGGATPSAGTFSLVMVVDGNANGAANWGDSITYDVSKVTVSNPYITTTCTQNGTMVMSSYAGFYPGYLWPAAQIIPLQSDLWTGGAADCTAALYGTSTTLTFHVGV